MVHHQSDGLADIQGRSPAKTHQAIGLVRLIGSQPRYDLGFHRITPDTRKGSGFQPARLKGLQNLRKNRQGGKALIADEQGALKTLVFEKAHNLSSRTPGPK